MLRYCCFRNHATEFCSSPCSWPVGSKAAPGGLSRKPSCYEEQDSARPSRLLPHVSLGAANLDREEPTVAFPRCTLSPGFGSPPRFRLLPPREPSRSGKRGGGVPLKLWGAGRGFLSPLSSPERILSVTDNRRRCTVSHNVQGPPNRPNHFVSRFCFLPDSISAPRLSMQ